MTERRNRPPAAGAALIAALALAGCSATHVGDDWQCPLAQGKVCASVFAADPAVPQTLASETRAPETLVPETLVPETRDGTRLAGAIPRHGQGSGRIVAGLSAGTADEPACESDCDPFAWLGSLFSGIGDAGDADSETGLSRRNNDVATDATAGPRVSRAAPVAGAVRDSSAATGHSASGALRAGSAAIAPPVPDDAPPPAEGEAAGDARADNAPDPAASDAFRTGEVVARIWIAPFVDADGIYREGSYVRAVIAPAEWRLR